MRIKKVAGVNRYLLFDDEGNDAGSIYGPEYSPAVVFPFGTCQEEHIPAYYMTHRYAHTMNAAELEFITEQCKRLGKHCFEYGFEDGRLSYIDGEGINE